MQLNYKSFGGGFPLVILHGLFGSLDNWQTIAKKLADRFHVYIIDQRNHGRSPHSDEFNYDLLADDLYRFFEDHQINKAHVMGHSMGGKTAMNFALKYPGKVDKLIVVDITPAAYGNQHSNIIRTLYDAQVASASSRENVERVLRNNFKEESLVQFFLKNLARDISGNKFHWKFNLDVLAKNYDRISESLTSSTTFDGETLFIKGEKSDYVCVSNYESINSLFPHHRIVEIKGAGHWVHAEMPEQFVEAVRSFL